MKFFLITCVIVTIRADETYVADRLLTNLTEISNEDILKRDLSGKNITIGVQVDAGALPTSGNVYDVLEMWGSFPKVIAPRGGSGECGNDTELYLSALRNFDLWALKMFDATAKLPSGILSGNLNQYGDFDECLSIGGESPVQGQYCLASVQFTHTLAHIDNLLHAHNYIRSNLTDQGHRVPRFSSTVWGVCLPRSCSARDLEVELEVLLQGTGAQVRVAQDMCTHKARSIVPPLGKAITVTIFAAILSLVALGTLLDDGIDGKTAFLKVLNAFSLRRNAKSLFDVKESPREISGVSGVRCLNALALLMAHKSMALTHQHFVNRTSMSEQMSEPWTVIGRTSIIYTDTFLYLSGLLNAHNLFQELEKTGTIDVKNRVLARIFRLLPLLATVMLFCTYILPDLSNGPQWGVVVEEHSRVCQRTMWRSFLFIHNFFGFENMCLTHTHQVALDLQLFLATPALALLVRRAPAPGWPLLGACAALSTLLRYRAALAHGISMVVYFGISVQSLLGAARYSYILPTHRATIYLFGVAMAYFFLSKRSKFNLTKSQAAAVWVTALALGFWAQLSPWRMGLKSYTYEPGPAAVYAAVSPLAWGGFLCLMHWAVFSGHGGWFGRFLNSRVFRFLNKLSYGVYLTQFPLFFYNVGVQRHSAFYTSLHIVYLPEIFSIIMLSIVTTLSIEMPFVEIHRKFFSKAKICSEKEKVH